MGIIGGRFGTFIVCVEGVMVVRSAEILVNTDEEKVHLKLVVAIAWYQLFKERGISFKDLDIDFEDIRSLFQIIVPTTSVWWNELYNEGIREIYVLLSKRYPDLLWSDQLEGDLSSAEDVDDFLQSLYAKHGEYLDLKEVKDAGE